MRYYLLIIDWFDQFEFLLQRRYWLHLSWLAQGQQTSFQHLVLLDCHSQLTPHACFCLIAVNSNVKLINCIYYFTVKSNYSAYYVSWLWHFLQLFYHGNCTFIGLSHFAVYPYLFSSFATVYSSDSLIAHCCKRTQVALVRFPGCPASARAGFLQFVEHFDCTFLDFALIYN